MDRDFNAESRRFLDWLPPWMERVIDLVRSIDRLARAMRARTTDDIAPRFHPIIAEWVDGITDFMKKKNKLVLKWAQTPVYARDFRLETRYLMRMLRPLPSEIEWLRRLPQQLQDSYCTPAAVAALPSVRREVVTWALDVHRALDEFVDSTHAFARACERFLAKKYSRRMRE